MILEQDQAQHKKTHYYRVRRILDRINFNKLWILINKIKLVNSVYLKKWNQGILKMKFL